MIQLVISLLTVLAAFSGGVAAWLWYLASQVDAPKKLEGFYVWGSRTEPNRVIIDTSPIIDFVQDSGRKNMAAAQ